MVALRSGEFQRTNELNDALGTFKTGETAYLLTLAHGVTPRLALGANLKVVQQTRRGLQRRRASAWTWAASPSVTRDLRVGAAVANLGGPTSRCATRTRPIRRGARRGWP